MAELSQQKSLFQHKIAHRHHVGYVILALMCCWLIFWLLNMLLLVSGIFNTHTPHISIGLAAYILFGLICLLPGCLILAVFALFRRLFQRVFPG